jgi:D-inositol-3-phosphate glycosyltransferase
VGGLGYLVQDGLTGYTVPDSDPGALSDKLSILLGNPQLRAEMGERAAGYAKEYDWEKIGASIMNVYREAARVESQAA